MKNKNNRKSSETDRGDIFHRPITVPVSLRPLGRFRQYNNHARCRGSFVAGAFVSWKLDRDGGKPRRLSPTKWKKIIKNTKQCTGPVYASSSSPPPSPPLSLALSLGLPYALLLCISLAPRLDFSRLSDCCGTLYIMQMYLSITSPRRTPRAAAQGGARFAIGKKKKKPTFLFSPPLFLCIWYKRVVYRIIIFAAAAHVTNTRLDENILSRVARFLPRSDLCRVNPTVSPWKIVAKIEKNIRYIL